jgi:predicted XRE-type DNA-binding protein
MAKTYEATARREGRWWIITVPELDAVTQARHVREIDDMAAGLVTAILDLDEGDVSVDVTVELPESVTAAWAEADKLQAEVEAVQRRAAALRREAVKALLDEGHLSQAEAGSLLGVSPQRVQQLAKVG